MSVGPETSSRSSTCPAATSSGSSRSKDTSACTGQPSCPGTRCSSSRSERTGELLVVGLEDGGIRRKLPTGGQATHMLALGGEWVYAANIASGTVSRIDLTGSRPLHVPGRRERAPRVWRRPPTGWRVGPEAWTAGRWWACGEKTGRWWPPSKGSRCPTAWRSPLMAPRSWSATPRPMSSCSSTVRRVRSSARIDVAAASAEAGLGGEPSPQGFVLSRDGRWAFVSTKAINRVAVVDLVGRRVVRFLEAGLGPDGIGFSPVRGGGA